MHRGIWGWVTAALGLVVIALMTDYVVAENVWTGQQLGLEGTVSAVPLYLTALVGVVLVIVGIAVAVRSRRTTGSDG